jgi:hypothetical protein
LINISKSGTSKEENFKLREERYIMEMNSKWEIPLTLKD